MMSEWIKVVTQPLGLAGFTLFLVFGALAKIKRNDERRWLAPAAFGIAVLSLAGCLLLAWAQTPKAVAQPAVERTAPSAKLDCQSAAQVSTGAGSPNVNCANGNVTINVDQSSGTKPTPQTGAAQPAPAK